MTRFVSLTLTAWAVVACLGVGDSLVSVRGKIEDPEGRPYERCVVSLILNGDVEPLDSLSLDGDGLKNGEMKASFHVPGRWNDCFVSVECDGAQEKFTSPRIGRERAIPLDLGKIVLERQQ